MASSLPSPTAMTTTFYDSPSSSTASVSSSSKREKRKSESSKTLAATSSPAVADPSPVESNGTTGTDSTDIDDTSAETNTDNTIEGKSTTPSGDTQANSLDLNRRDSLLGKLNTSIAKQTVADQDPAPTSVIHAPESFAKRFDKPAESVTSEQSANTVVSPHSPEALTPQAKVPTDNSTSQLKTDLPRAKLPERLTPQAQTIREAEEEWQKRKAKTSTLQGIPEGMDSELADEIFTPSDAVAPISRLDLSNREDPKDQITALQTALTECWTLCNTLAGLSSHHRSRMFNHRGKKDLQGHAWQTCWKLCQHLYQTRGDAHNQHMLPTLELCREFCQVLFECRHRNDEASDSVLRVSFELNNHLYNIHDRKLPDAFQERTLDFYLTLCHRLKKQRTSLPPETDALLRACWSLAELLFSIRQNKKDGNHSDEELLGSAVQACWDLCDLFREGWTQIRPDRTTPKANQTTFPQAGPAPAFRSRSSSNHSSPSLTRPSTSQSFISPNSNIPFLPETPTTIFDDIGDPLSDDEDMPVPNILVLGPDNSSSTNALSTSKDRWPSSASSVSSYTESTHPASSTATAPSHTTFVSGMDRIRILLVKTATNTGFQFRGYSPSVNSTSSNSSLSHARRVAQQNVELVTFVRNLPRDEFGSQSWQIALFDRYRKLVLAWPEVVSKLNAASVAAGKPNAAAATTNAGQLLTGIKQSVSAADLGKAVQRMSKIEEYAWLRDLYRVLFGCLVEDGIRGLHGVFAQG